MNDTYIVTRFVVVDDLLKAYAYRDDCRAQSSAAEVLTVAGVAAKYFQNHHEQALCLMSQLGYVGRVSISCFNRRLHALRDWLYGLVTLLGAAFAHGAVFLIDSMPLPVCKRARAQRCRKVRGRAFCGYCAAKQEKFFGWRLHLICTAEGISVSFDLLPASAHNLTLLHELAKGYLSHGDTLTLLQETGVRLVTPQRFNMLPNTWADDYDLAIYRKRIETVNSHLASMGI